MDSGVFNGWAGATTLPGWSVVGVADINYDGYADIVVQNQTTGQIEYANMDNGVFSGLDNVATMPGWKVVGAGDINGGGFADIVIQNQSNGEIDYANMQWRSLQWLDAREKYPWLERYRSRRCQSYGFDDIVIQNSTNGQIEYANMTAGVSRLVLRHHRSSGFTGATVPAPVGDNAATVGATATTVGATATTVGDTATTNVSMLDGGGFQSGDGSTPTPFNTDPGTPLNGASLQPFVTYQDSDDTIPSADGGGFTGLATTPDSVLPHGVWVAIQAANNVAPNASSTIGSETQDTSGSMQDVLSTPNSAAPNGGSPSSDSNMLPSLFMQESATATSVSGAADFVNNQNGSLGAVLPTSASWLTEGAQNGSTPTNGAAQVPGTRALAAIPPLLSRRTICRTCCTRAVADKIIIDASNRVFERLYAEFGSTDWQIAKKIATCLRPPAYSIPAQRARARSPTKIQTIRALPLGRARPRRSVSRHRIAVSQEWGRLASVLNQLGKSR